MKEFKIIVERHPDGYVAYPLGIKGTVVGQGNTYEAALSDVKSAIRFHIETFGAEMLKVEPRIIEAFITKAGVEVYGKISRRRAQKKSDTVVRPFRLQSGKGSRAHLPGAGKS